MANSDRPILGLDIECKIEASQNQIDLRYWNHLNQLLVPTPERAQMLRKTYPMRLFPPDLKQPRQLLSVLANYARELFDNEAHFTHAIRN